MIMKCDRNSVVVKCWVPFSNYCLAMSGNWGNYRVALTSRADATKNYNRGARLNCATVGCFISDTNDVIHIYP